LSLFLAHPRHALARLGAAAAYLGASEHLLITVRDPLAVLGALDADFRAHPARPAVHGRTPEHKVGARGADLRAVEQHRDVAGVGVLAAHLEAVLGRLKANGVAAEAILDASLHLGFHGATPGSLLVLSYSRIHI
jgi:hypothetical protein